MNSVRHVLGDAVRSLVRLPPNGGPSRIGVGARAGLALFIPLGILTLLGEQSIGLQTASGTFTALYAAKATARERAKVLPVIGLALVLCAALGSWLAPYIWVYMVGLVIVAVVASALCFAFRVGAPGPVFFVLVYGLASNVTAVVDGERANDPWVFIAATATGALIAYLLAIAPLMLPKARALEARPLRELLPGPWFGSEEQILTARIAIASVAGAAISVIWLDPSHAYWTVCACVAVVGLAGGRTLSVARGLHRVVGTLIGALIYMAIAPLGSYPWVVLIILSSLQFIIEQVVVRNYALALTFVTPLVLLLTGAVGGNIDPSTTAMERVADTAVGAALAIVTGLMHSKELIRTGAVRIPFTGAVKVTPVDTHNASNNGGRPDTARSHTNPPSADARRTGSAGSDVIENE